MRRKTNPSCPYNDVVSDLPPAYATIHEIKDGVRGLPTRRGRNPLTSGRSALGAAGKLLAVLCAAAVGALVFLFDRPYEQVPVNRGEVDLSHWDCHQPVSLDGTWLALGQALEGKRVSSEQDVFGQPVWTPVRVPGLWRDVPALHMSSGTGAVTYRLVATLPAACKQIMLEVPDPRSAVGIWVDGDLVSSVGQPSMTAAGELARSLAVLAPIQVKHQRTVIAFEVSDHRNRDGGITKHIVLGGDFVMRQHREGQLVGAALISGALMSMLVFIIAFGRADETGGSPWIFCLLCIFVVREVCVAGLLPKMVPSLDLNAIYRLEILCILLVWPVYSRVLRSEAKTDVSAIAGRVIDILGALGILAAIILPERPLVRVGSYVYFYSISCAAWSLVVISISELRNDRSSLAFTGSLVIFIELMLHDFVEYRQYLPITELSPIGILLLMFAHVIAKGRQFASARTRAQTLTTNLASANRDLDARVHERTRELSVVVRQLETAKATAEETVRVRTRFLAHLSHEVRNPLNIILGTVRLVHRRIEEKEAVSQLDSIRTIGNGLIALLDDALDMARLESGTVRLRTETFDPCRFLNELAEVYSRQCAGKGLGFEAEIVCPELGLEGDAPRIYQILSNLLNNAVKFTMSGEVRLRATVSVISTEKAVLCAEIADTGPGIPASDFERIFEEFERSEMWQDLSGSGLGLAISRQLARAMGGDISLSSAEGNGSLFIFEVALPWSAAKLHEDGFLEVAGQIEGGKSALIVEDSPEGRVLLSEQTKFWGMKSTGVASASECLSALDRAIFDVILLDINLGRSSGFDVLSALRCHPSPVVALTPVIAVTASLLLVDIESYLQAGADSVISKPINFEELFEAIRLVLGQTQSAAVYQDGLATLAVARAAPAFARTCLECSLELDEARSLGDIEQLRSVIHRLRGSAATFGYMELESACKMAEVAIAVGMTDGFALDRLRLVLNLVNHSATAEAINDRRQGRLE